MNIEELEKRKDKAARNYAYWLNHTGQNGIVYNAQIRHAYDEWFSLCKELKIALRNY